MMTVRDVMTRSVLSVRPETPLKDVARMLIDHAISGVPVVNAEGRVLGIVSEADFLIKEQGAEHVHHRPLARIFGESRESQTQMAKLEAATAAEAMTAPPLTIDPTRPMSEAAAIMTTHGVNRLPVVDDGVLVGIVTRADLVRAYVRTDEDLEKTIREDVLLRILWLDPSTFTVQVRNGIASIRGQVERRSTAAMVEHAIAMVPGIVDILADVSWSLDDSAVQPATRSPIFPFGPH